MDGLTAIVEEELLNLLDFARAVPTKLGGLYALIWSNASDTFLDLRLLPLLEDLSLPSALAWVRCGCAGSCCCCGRRLRLGASSAIATSWFASFAPLLLRPRSFPPLAAPTSPDLRSLRPEGLLRSFMTVFYEWVTVACRLYGLLIISTLPTIMIPTYRITCTMLLSSDFWRPLAVHLLILWFLTSPSTKYLFLRGEIREFCRCLPPTSSEVIRYLGVNIQK